jgi:predicted O-methyltransferase YrrM
MKLARHMQEVFRSTYYRTRPIEAVRLGYAKWLLSKFRFHDPAVYLRDLGFNTDECLKGFEHWEGMMRSVIDQVFTEGGQQGGISIEDGIVLFGLTRALQPNVVIETGIAAGVSTCFFSAALIENGHGHLYSIDLQVDKVLNILQPDGAVFAWAEKGVGWAIPQVLRDGMKGRHTMILNDVRVALPQLLATLDQVDLFFHDDLHTPDHMKWEYELLWKHLPAGGVMASDDINYGWVSFCSEQKLGPLAYRNIQRLAVLRKGPAMALPVAV